jgi:hypothetical protein
MVYELLIFVRELGKKYSLATLFVLIPVTEVEMEMGGVDC